MYVQLERYLRGLIQAQRLAAGTKIPASREVAAAIGVSRNTVSQAYEELVAEGLLTAHVGQGTFVAPPSARRLTAVAATERTRSREFVWPGLFALRARTLTLPGGFRAPRGAAAIRWDFRGGQVAADELPTRELARAFTDVMQQALPHLAHPHHIYGHPPLRRDS